VTDPAPLPTATPPGWYPEPPTGRQRWWDGIQWAFYPPEGHETGAARPSGSTGPTPTNPYAGVVYPTRYQHPTNGLATASLVLGIIGVVMCTLIVPSVLAVVFGIIGVRMANQRGGEGKGKAIWGLILGGLVVFVLAVALVVSLGS
jgi:hypothetical protein